MATKKMKVGDAAIHQGREMTVVAVGDAVVFECGRAEYDAMRDRIAELRETMTSDADDLTPKQVREMAAEIDGMTSPLERVSARAASCEYWAEMSVWIVPGQLLSKAQRDAYRMSVGVGVGAPLGQRHGPWQRIERDFYESGG